MAKVMIGVDHGSYSFNAATKQVTINLENGEVLSLERILLITNTTDNVVIYNFSNPSLGGTVSGSVLTLTYNTVSMSNSDKLQIWYYSEADLEVRDLLVAELRNLINVIASNTATLNTAGELRAVLSATTTIAQVNTMGTITTLTTLANQTSIGGLAASLDVPSTMQIPIELQNQKIIVT